MAARWLGAAADALATARTGTLGVDSVKEGIPLLAISHTHSLHKAVMKPHDIRV